MKTVRLIFLLFLPPLLTFANTPTTQLSHFTKHDTKGQPNPTESSAPPFKGLILVPNPNDLNPLGYGQVCGIMAYQMQLPGNIVSLKKAMRTFFNKSIDKNVLLAIKTRIIEFYQNHNRPIVMVTVPEQDISDGVIQVVVTEGKLGKVTLSGDKWFNGDKIKEDIRLEPGEVIASDILNQDLYWMNRNPFRNIDAVYSPGTEMGATDIELKMVDRFPLRTYIGIDNTGNDVTGNNRLFAGFNWGKVFWTDQRLSYQYSTSSDFKRFQAHTLFYEAPLPWRHLLTLYGGYSRVDADFAVPNIKGTKFRTHGFTLQISMRYDIPLQPRKDFLHELIWGFDFKRTNNNLDFGGRPVISEDNVNLTQFMLGYNLGYAIKPFELSFEIEGLWSPGKWISDQTNADYQSLRPYAKNQYVYTRSALTATWRYYKGWTLYNSIRWQWVSINLLPSEEYGVGGYNTVRGYKERIVNGDNVFIWNFEMRTPSVSILNALAGWKKFHDEFQALIFFDYGWAGIKRAAPGQPKAAYLTSIGPGIRYNIIPYLTFRADWGFQLHNLDLGGPYQRLHFALIVGY